MKLYSQSVHWPLALSLTFLIAACGPKEEPVSPPPEVAPAPPAVSTDGLKIEDIQIGSGAVAAVGKRVAVHYTGWLTNGKKFDSSKDRGQAFTFQLGAGQVIKGWDHGVAGMKVGGVRKLTIPPALGYGDRDMGVIPPDSTLEFEVELLGVQ